MAFSSYFDLFHKLRKVSNFEPVNSNEITVFVTKKQRITKILKLIHFWFVIGLMTVLVLSLTVSAIESTENLRAIVAIVADVLYGSYAIFRSLWLLANRDELTNLLDLLEFNFPSTAAGQFNHSTHDHLRVFKAFQAIYLFLCFGYFLSFGVEPLAEMITSGGRKFPIPIRLP
jgi:hypothetical protein